MKKIDSLTSAQQQALIAYRAKWLAIGRSTEPADRPKAEAAITEMYRLLGKGRPRFWWSDGPAVGSMVRTILTSARKKTVANLRSNLRSSLESSLRSNLRWDLWSSLESSLGSNLGSSLRSNLRWDLWSSLESSLESSLRSSLESSLGSNLGWGFSGSAGWETAWAAFYAFPDLVIKSMYTDKDRHKLALWLALSESTGWWHPFENIAFMCERPRIQLVDENGRLHADGGPALLCRDGWPLYSLHGIAMKPEYVLTPAEKIDPLDILQETNVDMRRELIRKVGVEMMLSHLPHKILDRVGDYSVLRIDFPGLVDNTRYLKMMNPSVGVWHLEGIERECDTVEKAINWRAGQFAEDESWNPEVLT